MGTPKMSYLLFSGGANFMEIEQVIMEVMETMHEAQPLKGI
jgi:hypothetical protein